MVSDRQGGFYPVSGDPRSRLTQVVRGISPPLLLREPRRIARDLCMRTCWVVGGIFFSELVLLMLMSLAQVLP